MRRCRVAVYDDDPKAAERFVLDLKKATASVRNAVDVRTLSGTEFSKGLTILRARQRSARGTKQAKTRESSCFDECDILIIDFDLEEVDSDGMILTGEEVAYNARAFSACGVIVSVNQVKAQTFDLTLRDAPESRAELNINVDDLPNSGLWSATSWPEYRPWQWPLLPLFASNFSRMVADVKNHLREKVGQFFGFPKKLLETLPRDISGFLGNPSEVTFDDIARSRLRPKDQGTPRQFKARVGASMACKWLNDVVLPGQDVLVDTPHLVSRYPSLLKGNPKSASAYDKTATLDDWNSSSIHFRVLVKYQFPRRHWLTRPAWWSSLEEDRKVHEIDKPWEFRSSPFVFAEDTSRFHRRPACREFVAASSSPYARRFVKVPLDINYEPQVRFAMTA